MSKVENNLINIPRSLSFHIYKNSITFKGNSGLVNKSFLNLIFFIYIVFNSEIDEKKNLRKLYIFTITNKHKIKGYLGLTKILIENMIQGANEGFSKTLIAEGIGYKFKIDKETLILNIGLSHSIKLSIPTTLTINLDSTTRLTLIGTEKENVTFFCC
jgi:large subunit ribosomal protein L6